MTGNYPAHAGLKSAAGSIIKIKNPFFQPCLLQTALPADLGLHSVLCTCTGADLPIVLGIWLHKQLINQAEKLPDNVPVRHC